ncbi:MAG: hypothetical protein UY70_C0005G0022 [Candidatus Kaiserbacteria bacterium GW2011_GWB1_52_6]|uniref:Uncharacterized protein n=3 Tax=Candidatus Kaiseribacteriota TaxID=1752734 RepID=A0A0G1XM80_9BACT|nr:MAG: hypothetical protein UY67_C0004G0017 [Candidatus Kaiserbacteria bacterium GW2011_GWA2_52_12]KKW27958.1 MAG: hypothetical protein UY70_C0005G0022 [Candidatus Kaiserbacteria bacterium GW2011_GWB1_52_6]KKW31975.1 MAG: hypothetical protein UY74_C0002G0011 [Candidatus Kaiserbacteria bacterium GW2011_GWC2_52_8b]
MDPELRQKLDTLEQKIDAAYTAAEKTRKYLMWAGIVSIALVVLPMIGLLFAIPAFISTYSEIGNLSL